MKKISNQKLINSLEKRIENHLQIAIEKFQNLDEEILLHHAEDGGWSIAQCLWHLNSYGDYYIPEINKRIQKSRTSPSTHFKSTWFGSYFIRMMEPETGTKKIKAFKSHIPKKQLDAYAVVAEFIRQQEELTRLVKISKNIDLNKVKVPISISKWLKLKLGDVFQFLKAHDERHIRQALRVLDRLKTNPILPS